MVAGPTAWVVACPLQDRTQVNTADRADRRGCLPGIPTAIKPVSSGAADALAAAKFWAAAPRSDVDENSPADKAFAEPGRAQLPRRPARSASGSGDADPGAQITL
jgi:hypothetical protein